MAAAGGSMWVLPRWWNSCDWNSARNAEIMPNTEPIRMAPMAIIQVPEVQSAFHSKPAPASTGMNFTAASAPMMVM